MAGRRAWVAMTLAVAIAGCRGPGREPGPPAPSPAAEAPEPAACGARLRAFWEALQAYARAHAGRLPDSRSMSEVMARLGPLAPAGEHADLCPVTLLPYAWNEAAAGRSLTEAAGTLPLLYDDFLFGEHPDGECLALYGDGQIRKVSKRQLEAEVLRAETTRSPSPQPAPLAR